MGNGWFGVATSTIGVFMQTSSQDAALLEKWRLRTVREKAKIIAAFLNECGENAKWEDWCDFLHKHQVKGFKWMESVD